MNKQRALAALVGLALASFLFTTVPSQPALAANIEIDSLEDNDTAGDFDCTLREAINNANADADTTNGDCEPGSGVDTIGAQAGLSGQIDLSTPLPNITDNESLTIDFVFAVNIVGPNSFRIFTVDAGASLLVQRTQVSGGNAGAGDGGAFLNNGTLELFQVQVANSSAANGGGIANNGELTLNQAFVRNNNATGSSGGGGLFTTTGTVTIDQSTFDMNTTDAGNGGGILSFGGEISITDSIFSQNTSAANGGAIAALANSDGDLTIVRTTLSDNDSLPPESGGGGGAIYSQQPLRILNSTISGNSASANGGVGGGIHHVSSTAEISFTTFAGNTASSGGNLFVEPLGEDSLTLKNSILDDGGPDNCAGSGTISDAGGNFSSDATCSTFTQVTSAQINLGPLTNNGGAANPPTETHALQLGSVAIDAAADCMDIGGVTIDEDQRDVTRPQDGNGDMTPECDAGAYEATPGELATPTPTSTSTPGPSNTPGPSSTPTQTRTPTRTPTRTVTPLPTATSVSRTNVSGAIAAVVAAAGQGQSGAGAQAPAAVPPGSIQPPRTGGGGLR